MKNVQEYVDGIDDVEARQRALALLIAKELLVVTAGFAASNSLAEDYPTSLIVLAEYILWGTEDGIDPALVAALDELEADGMIERVPNEEAEDADTNP
jgi:hypothetical protein